ncbi:MAG: histidine--tRNA ligase [Deltaproteobacteria bacterium]|nr:histidine--tRNA ligase [Deltaproteobacteria bacterium]
MQSLPGFKDILPAEIRKWQFVENICRDIFESFGYQEIRFPVLEKAQLFSRSVGNDTDIVQKEMYTFKDKGDQSVTLRPEGTACVVRALIQHNLIYKGMHKFYYVAPMFRYERPQRGRLREFHHLGVEAFGDPSPYVDAEIMEINMEILKKLNVDVRVEINNIGCKKCRPLYIKVLKEYLMEKKGLLCEDCQRRLNTNPLRVLDCKKESCRKVTASAPSILDYVCNECKNHFNEVQRLLTKMKVDFVVNDKIVRGLDYYTSFVFEIISDRLGAQGTVSAGGRYNDLVEELGGSPTPACGFAAGEERIIELFDYKEDDRFVDAVVVPVGKDAMDFSFFLTENLRKEYIRSEFISSGSLKSALRKANRWKAKWVLIIGEDEMKEDMVSLRDLERSVQKKVKVKDVISVIRRGLDE